jgi:hypothetical protein
MAITYTYKIKSLATATERINKQEFPHTIRAIIWDLTGTDETGVSQSLSDITTFIQFKTKDTGSFIGYSSLSEDNVVDFIKIRANVEELKHTISERFNTIPGQVAPNRVVEVMPWYFNGKTAISGSSI